jgi:hypothetical protein
MNDCLTWAKLSDKAAVGEQLTGEQRMFMRRHPSGCSTCASEVALWDNLEKVLEEPERLTSRSSTVEAARGPWRRLVPAGVWQRRTALAGAVAVTAVAAASAALWNGTARPAAPHLSPQAVAARPRPSSTASAVDAPGAQLAFSSGETLVNRRAALAGERLAAGAVVSVGVGQACLLVPPGVSVCLDDHSELSIETLEVHKRRFRLHSGHAVAHLDPQPAGSSFGFETPAGSVVAKGTVFSLRTDGSTVTLRVHEGVVLNSRGSETSAYQAPSTALLSHEPGALRARNEAMSDARLVELASYFSDASQATLVVTAGAGSRLALGDFYLGMAPLSALLRPGDYRMEVSRSGFATIVERLKLEPKARVVRDYEGTELDVAASKEGAKAPRSVVPPSATELLERARDLRAGGHYRDAHGAYQRLLREYGGSAEARVALVSLGELQLSQLGDAGAALRSFEAYLRGGGALRQEASYGRIRALRRLGKLREAEAATAAFISKYPRSVQAATLRKELP